MSRNRRKRGETSRDLLEDLQDNNLGQPGSDFTASHIANEGYESQVGGTFANLPKTVRAVPTPIDEIFPDITQPRRAIPMAVRHYWNGQPDTHSVTHLFERWLAEINQAERGNQPGFDVDAYLIGKETERAPYDISEDDEPNKKQASRPLETSLLKIIELAASIYRDGLANPITIARRDTTYVIETGERRWLAYHLLNWRDQTLDSDGEDWSRIPARVVDHISIWRQASENNARTDLNAISKARQLSLLLMDLYGSERFQPFQDFEHEQGYYAQVADGTQWRIPRGEGESLLNAMGLKHPNQLRHIRRLLRLPQIVWEIADDLDWSESFIQKQLLNNARNEKELIQVAVRHALAAGYTVSKITVYAESSGEKERKREKKAKAGPPREARQSWKWLGENYHRLEQLAGEERDQARQQLAHLQAWIAEVEEKLQP